MQSNLLQTGIVSPPSEPSKIITLDFWGLSNSYLLMIIFPFHILDDNIKKI